MSSLAEVITHVVRVESHVHDGRIDTASGVAVGPGRVITCGHVVAGSRRELRVRYLGEALDVEDQLVTNTDLSLLIVPELEILDPIDRSDVRPQVGDEVDSAGWPNLLWVTLEAPVVLHGRVATGTDVEVNVPRGGRIPRAFLLDFPGLGGMSGGAVIDASGRLVGIHAGTIRLPAHEDLRDESAMIPPPSLPPWMTLERTLGWAIPISEVPGDWWG
jgi:S1-C subfamily serine protease